MLGAPDVQCPKLRKKLLRRAKKVLIVVVLATLLFLVPTFFLFGMLINHLNEDKMCGAIGQLSAPECTHVSWEFCVLIGLLLFRRHFGAAALVVTAAVIAWDVLGQDGRGLALDFFSRTVDAEGFVHNVHG